MRYVKSINELWSSRSKKSNEDLKKGEYRSKYIKKPSN